MLRSIAIWSRARPIVILLGALSLGQWAILFHGIATVRSTWNPLVQSCVVSETKAVFLTLIYLYSESPYRCSGILLMGGLDFVAMSFDLLVLIVSTIGLVRSPGRSTLWSLIFRQGIIYFFVAFVANSIPAIFLLLDLNPVMNIMFAIPAALASAIVACRSFVSLSEYRNKDIYVQ